MSREPMKNNMNQVMDNSSTTLLFSEVLDKVHKAKTKAQKVSILREHNNASLRMVIKSSFDPKIKWAMPEGDVPFMPNDAPAGTDHTRLATEAKKLYHFIEGADNTTPKMKKETMFIQMLEGLQEKDAEVLMAVKNKNLNNIYKGLTSNLVKETFNWNDDFNRIDKK